MFIAFLITLAFIAYLLNLLFGRLRDRERQIITAIPTNNNNNTTNNNNNNNSKNHSQRTICFVNQLKLNMDMGSV